MRKLALATVALSLLAAPALAGPKEEAVEARQGQYKLMKANMGVLAGMAKGEIEYDAEKAKMHAANLAALGKNNIGFLYVPGTSTDEMAGKTRALPNIWTDMAGVGAVAKKYGAAVAALQPVAGEGRAALGKAVGAVGAGCKGCHDTYRAK